MSKSMDMCIYGAENPNFFCDGIKQMEQGETALNSTAYSDQVFIHTGNTCNAGITLLELG